jgi:glutamate racemase
VGDAPSLSGTFLTFVPLVPDWTGNSGLERGYVVNATAPVGILDSGVGGLTVARAVIDLLPNESIVYVGDTANGPYGPKPIAQVREHALGVMDSLIARGVKALVIACNSASAATLQDARERYSVPVIEVIGPAVRRAVRATRNGRVGVIGTRATIGSGAYQDLFQVAGEVEVFAVACPRFVKLVESGVTSGSGPLEVAEGYLAPLKATGVDTLVLGCTHYPLLTGPISYVMGEDVTLISSADETARDLYQLLTDRGLLNQSTDSVKREFLATGDTSAFGVLAKRFLGPEVESVSQIKVPT